ncbi:hypothetical protein M501DRAFT_1001562 [Patellaria atrata CBS 101060]|uniref:Uncharacterized protein n=1 Tax=Patellaria atrata CBS 101060 TaxID=1346257 RepID=A0A9P4VR54_9PEZI|nr:hypothetical protein M501DRAFT_1001562 [Patellaria atrata CBS 101060]
MYSFGGYLRRNGTSRDIEMWELRAKVDSNPCVLVYPSLNPDRETYTIATGDDGSQMLAYIHPGPRETVPYDMHGDLLGGAIFIADPEDVQRTET